MARPRAKVEPAKAGSQEGVLTSRVAERLTAIRVARGMTQAELAKAIKWKQSVLARIEVGRSSLSCRTIERMADALGVDVDDLIGKQPPRKRI